MLDIEARELHVAEPSFTYLVGKLLCLALPIHEGVVEAREEARKELLSDSLADACASVLPKRGCKPGAQSNAVHMNYARRQ